MWIQRSPAASMMSGVATASGMTSSADVGRRPRGRGRGRGSAMFGTSPSYVTLQEGRLTPDDVQSAQQRSLTTSTAAGFQALAVAIDAPGT